MLAVVLLPLVPLQEPLVPLERQIGLLTLDLTLLPRLEALSPVLDHLQGLADPAREAAEHGHHLWFQNGPEPPLGWVRTLSASS